MAEDTMRGVFFIMETDFGFSRGVVLSLKPYPTGEYKALVSESFEDREDALEAPIEKPLRVDFHDPIGLVSYEILPFPS